MTHYINIYGGPGVGKSTIAAGLFYEMKTRGYSVELVTEYVKDLVWENRQDTIAIQPYVSMKQFRNLYRLQGKVDYVVTDSPLPKDIAYAKKYAPYLPQSYYEQLVHYDSILGPSTNVVLQRMFKYDTQGRFQNLEQAQQLDSEIVYYLQLFNLKYTKCVPILSSVYNCVFIES